jgi:hypothetical protein
MMKKFPHKLKPLRFRMQEFQMPHSFLPRKWLKFKLRLKLKWQLSKEDK